MDTPTSSKKQKLDTPPPIVPENLELSEEALEATKTWLARFNKPCESVEEKWMQTLRMRRDGLLTCKQLKTFIQDEWPLFNNSEYGPALVRHQNFVG